MLWTTPSADPPLVAVVCSPHPLFGGTMHNKVVFRAAKALHLHGLPVLRFNFRGAGLSEGTHDQGRGEQEDVRAALDYLAEEFPRRTVLLAGFSFGSWVGLRVACQDARVTDLIGIGLPVNNSDFTYLRTCTKPKLLISGAEDAFGSRSRIEALFQTLPGPKRLVIIEGADHFLAGKLDEMDCAIEEWLSKKFPPAIAGSRGS